MLGEAQVFGLICMITQRFEAKEVTLFLEDVLSMNKVTLDKINYFLSVYILYACNSERDLFEAIIYLDFPHSLLRFVLMCKHRMDPKFIGEKSFRELGVTRSEIIQKRLYIA
jgi:hypothetical protein